MRYCDKRNIRLNALTSIFPGIHSSRAGHNETYQKRPIIYTMSHAQCPKGIQGKYLRKTVHCNIIFLWHFKVLSIVNLHFAGMRPYMYLKAYLISIKEISQTGRGTLPDLIFSDKHSQAQQGKAKLSMAQRSRAKQRLLMKLWGLIFED